MRDVWRQYLHLRRETKSPALVSKVGTLQAFAVAPPGIEPGLFCSRVGSSTGQGFALRCQEPPEHVTE